MDLGPERDGYTCTVQCGWFPDGEQPPACRVRSEPGRRGDESALETEMHRFGAATRMAFNRLVDGLKRVPGQPVMVQSEREQALRRDLKRDLQPRFGLNSRYTNDAVAQALGVIGSARERLPEEIRDAEAKRGKTQRKLQGSATGPGRLCCGCSAHGGVGHC